MTYDGRRFRGDQTEEILDDLGPAGVAPGKRTLTQGLASAHAAGDDDDALRLPVIQMALVDGAPRPGGGGGDHLLDAALRPDLHTGSGRPLDAGVRAGMERSFGADFGAVRVHEGPHVADAGALAYARGADLHFAPGQYAPESDRGRELIGHELAHVVQQAQGRVGATAQAKGAQLNDDASLEREADELGSRAARGEPVAAPGATPVIAADASRGVMQRYAWVGGTQLTRASPHGLITMQPRTGELSARSAALTTSPYHSG
jgi:hypothetical protein